MSSSSPAPSSPPRHRAVGDVKEERPRFFDSLAKKLCWAKADTVPGRHPERWRKDAAGNVVCKRFGNCQGCLCFEYDHIVPFSKGGESVVENCQILQTRVNRVKSDKDHLDTTQLRGYSCDISFTEWSEEGDEEYEDLKEKGKSLHEKCMAARGQRTGRNDPDNEENSDAGFQRMIADAITNALPAITAHVNVERERAPRNEEPKNNNDRTRLGCSYKAFMACKPNGGPVYKA